ncbi:MAG: DUF1800 family protein [Pseudomonadales bacterium]
MVIAMVMERDEVDNCPLLANASQVDDDGDGIGDVCDAVDGIDTDGDGVTDAADNCPNWWNPLDVDTDSNGIFDQQKDANDDLIGDACQCGDITGDGLITAADTTRFGQIMTNGGIARDMTLPELERCDVSGDGVCTDADKVILDNHIANATALPNSSCPTLALVNDRALGRIAYGPDKWTRTRMQDLQANTGTPYGGLEAFIQEQMSPDSIIDPDFKSKWLTYSKNAVAEGILFPATYPTINMGIKELRTSYCNDTDEVFCTSYQNDWYHRPLNNNRDIKFLRAVYSRRQLDAVLGDFWFNHFNVDATKGVNRWAQGDYETTIRGKMYGQFEGLLTATATHPAMLEYLDQNVSRASNSNENYAREVMELHTVGLARDQRDTFTHPQIIEVTRILTGMQHNGYSTYQYQFDGSDHDQGSKVLVFGLNAAERALANDPTTGNAFLEAHQNALFFGYTDRTNAISECDGTEATLGGNEPLVLFCKLARHPMTADTIGVKLIQRFLGDTALYDPDVDGPAGATVGDTKGDLLATLDGLWATGLTAAAIPASWTSVSGQGDIKPANLSAITNALLMSDDFKRSLYYEVEKVKRPTVFSASLARALGSDSEGASNTLTTYWRSSRETEQYFHSFNALSGDNTKTGESVYMFGAPTGHSEESTTWTSTTAMVNHFRAVSRLMNSSTQSADLGAVITHLGLTATSLDGAPLVQAVAKALGVVLPVETATSIVNFLPEDTANPGNTSTDEKIRRAVIAVLSTPEFISH